ncbi:restriction endonuclease subunit S [Litorimonas sp. WD9-15]|uniref:restriction endonuclease subunit S n=1 Tax=Litorimonas sp. WD9-15 TaxID=3418716 RepID=UPI003D09030C
MSSITSHKFSDLYKMSSGISSKPEQAGHGSPFLSFSSVFNNYFLPENLPDFMNVSQSEQMRYSIKEGDIFLTRTSETIDDLGMSSVAAKDYPSATYSGFLKRLRPTQSDVTYPKYMAFYLRSKLFRKTMTNNAVLTLRASLNEDIFSYLDLLLPEYTEQVKIGDLLHLISQKISLNNTINSELETLAKTIYDYWFVQFDFPDENGRPYKTCGGELVYDDKLGREIPSGWSGKDLGDLCKLYQPKTISGKDMVRDGKYLVYGANGIVGRYDQYNHKDSVVTVTCRGASCGTLNVTLPCSWITGNAMVVQPFNKDLNIDFITNSLTWANLDSAITGSAQPQITRTNLAPIKICLPKANVLESYNRIINPSFEKRNDNLLENQKLSKLRDWLLPMLMSGQITVGD